MNNKILLFLQIAQTTIYYKIQVAPPEGNAQAYNYKESLEKRFCDCTDTDSNFINMVNSCQIHICNKFCLRLTKDCKTKYCRCGCGSEKDKDSGITEGFPLMTTDKIVIDKNTQIKHLKLKRTTSQRMTQCSKYLLQSWRANCDIQLLLYD